MLANTLATMIQQLAFQKGKKNTGIIIGLQSAFSLLLAIYGGILIFNQLILVPIFFIIGIGMIFIGNALLIQFQTRLEEIDSKKPVTEENHRSCRYLPPRTNNRSDIVLENGAGSASYHPAYRVKWKPHPLDWG